MKYIFHLCSRAIENNAADKKHDSLIHLMKSIKDPWGIQQDVNIPFKDFGKEFTSIISLNSFFKKGIKCTLFYRYRNMLKDDALSDDRIYFEFNVKKIDYAELVNNVFTNYIKIFNAYSAVIFPEEIIYLDFEKSRNVNLREKIIRFYPGMFMDYELCIRALKKTPEEVIQVLKNQAEKVELLNDGVLIIASSQTLSIEECNEFNKRVMSCLDILIP